MRKETTSSVSSRNATCLAKKRAMARARSAGGGRGRPVVAPRVLEVVLAQPLVGPEQDVLGHVGRVSAGRGPAAERLRQATNVMWPRSAADAQVADPERVGLLA